MGASQSVEVEVKPLRDRTAAEVAALFRAGGVSLEVADRVEPAGLDGARVLGMSTRQVAVELGGDADGAELMGKIVAGVVEAELLPPPAIVRRWLEGEFDGGPAPQKIAAAMPWLHAALAASAASRRVKRAAIELLQRAKFTRGLAHAKVFGDLATFCRAEARRRGSRLAGFYEREGLRERLGTLSLPRHPAFAGDAPCRQDGASFALASPLAGGDWGTVASETVALHVLRLLALALDDAWQAAGPHERPPLGTLTCLRPPSL